MKERSQSKKEWLFLAYLDLVWIYQISCLTLPKKKPSKTKPQITNTVVHIIRYIIQHFPEYFICMVTGKKMKLQDQGTMQGEKQGHIELAQGWITSGKTFNLSIT